jgi:CBS domain containing-hemolysin-like protein
MSTCDTDTMLAKAQIVLAMIFTVAIFTLLTGLIFLHAEMSPTTLALVSSVLTALVTILTLMMNYFFARQRPHTNQDPPDLPDPIDIPGGGSVKVERTTATTSSTISGAPPAPASVASKGQFPLA